MIRHIIGGVTILVIGGTSYAIKQSNVVSNFSKNTGMSQQQSQQYVNNISKNDLQSFSKIGQGFVSDGNSILTTANKLDCANYTYQWVSASLTCSDGVSQLQAIGTDEISLGNCYESLDSDLGSNGASTINECITDINTVDSDYGLPVATVLLDSKTADNIRNTDAYNKSVLEAALQSK